MPDRSALTDSEREALRWVGLGYQTDEIAQRTNRSPRTIDNRILSARQKLGGVSRRQAARLLADMEGEQKLPEQFLSVPNPALIDQPIDRHIDAMAGDGGVREDRTRFDFEGAAQPVRIGKREDAHDISYARLIERTFQVAVCLALLLFALPWLVRLFNRLAAWVLLTFYS